MGIKVAIVGATGVLGKNLVARFQKEGREIRALVRSPREMEGLLAQGSETLPCDLLRIPVSLLAEYLKGCDTVIHAATALPPRPFERRSWEWHWNNRLRTEGTARLIEAAWRAGVVFYLQQSTVSAYVDGGERVLDEDTPFDIVPARAVETLAVAEMERLVRGIPYPFMRWAILRVGTFAGPGTRQEVLVENLLAGRERVPGEGNDYFSPVHVADAAAAFARAARVKPEGGVFNIVGEPLRYGDYLDGLAERLGAVRPVRDPKEEKFPSHRCSNESAGRELGWSPERSIWPVENRVIPLGDPPLSLERIGG